MMKLNIVLFVLSFVNNIYSSNQDNRKSKYSIDKSQIKSDIDKAKIKLQRLYDQRSESLLKLESYNHIMYSNRETVYDWTCLFDKIIVIKKSLKNSFDEIENAVEVLEDQVQKYIFIKADELNKKIALELAYYEHLIKKTIEDQRFRDRQIKKYITEHSKEVELIVSNLLIIKDRRLTKYNHILLKINQDSLRQKQLQQNLYKELRQKKIRHPIYKDVDIRCK